MQNTLPHNVNLKRWNKSESDLCPLCGNRQTLLHVLNNCPVALKSDRYTWRHNSVLKAISGHISTGLKHGWNMTTDLNTDEYALPVPLSLLTARPDIAVWNLSLHRIYFVELTVAFDTNLEEARDIGSRGVPVAFHGSVLSVLQWTSQSDQHALF